jgi:RHS repeat-associated protein
LKPLLFKQERISGRLSELLIHALPEDVSVWMEGRAIVTTQSGSMTCSGYPRNEASTNPSGHPSLASASASSNNTASTIHFASPMTYPAARAIEVFPEQHCPTGGRSNRESRNDYYRARYYSSNDARFLMPDPSGLYYGNPLNPQSLNLYSYVGNEPLSRIDLMGLCWKGFSWACHLWHQTTSFVSHTIFRRHYTGRVYDINYILHVHASRGSSNGSSSGFLNRLKSAYCFAVPTGRSISLSGALGGVGAVSGEGDMVLNYNSGQTSLFGTGGMSFGWNGGASVTATTGLVYGLGKTNNGFSGPFKGASFYAPTPIPFVGAGGSVIRGGGVTVFSAGASAALAGKYGGGISVTDTSHPLNTGRFTDFSLGDYLGFLARAPCQ